MTDMELVVELLSSKKKCQLLIWYLVQFGNFEMGIQVAEVFVSTR